MKQEETKYTFVYNEIKAAYFVRPDTLWKVSSLFKNAL